MYNLLESLWKKLQSATSPLDTNLYDLEAKLNQVLDKIQPGSDKGVNVLVNSQLRQCIFKSIEYKYKQPQPVNPKAMAMVLNIISTDLGLELYPSEDSINVMTICGVIFVLDVMFIN